MTGLQRSLSQLLKAFKGDVIMLTRLVADFLRAFLDLPGDSVEINSGTIILSRVRLRPDAVDGVLFLLGFPWTAPLTLVEATVDSLKIQLPSITNITTHHASVEIEGVNLVFCPQDAESDPSLGCRDRAASLLAFTRSSGLKKQLALLLSNALVTVRSVSVLLRPAPTAPVGLRVAIERITSYSTDESWNNAMNPDLKCTRRVVALSNLSLFAEGVAGPCFAEDVSSTLKITVLVEEDGLDVAAVLETSPLRLSVPASHALLLMDMFNSAFSSLLRRAGLPPQPLFLPRFPVEEVDDGTGFLCGVTTGGSTLAFHSLINGVTDITFHCDAGEVWYAQGLHTLVRDVVCTRVRTLTYCVHPAVSDRNCYGHTATVQLVCVSRRLSPHSHSCDAYNR